MTIDEPTISNKYLRSVCCEAKVHGHPESPSGDPPRCIECGKETGVLCLITYALFISLKESSEESSERYNKLATPLMNLHAEIHQINDEAGE